MISGINKLLLSIIHNHAVRSMLQYYIISTLLFLMYLIIINRINKKTHIESIGVRKREKPFLIFIITSIIFAIPLITLYYVGYLPYGPDTNSYTEILVELKHTGHYRGQSYYAPYHTSAVMFSLTSFVLGSGNLPSMQASYILLIESYIFLMIFVLSISMKRILRSNQLWVILLIVALLFISSPEIGGIDLLQQWVASVYGFTAIMLLIMMSTQTTSDVHLNNISTMILYILFVTVSVLTHLTPLIFATLLLIAYFTLYRSDKILFGFVIFLVISMIYALFFIEPNNILKSLVIFLKSLSRGTIGPFTIRAYTELSSSYIGLMAWVTLPSISTAYLILLLTKVFKRSNITRLERFLLATIFLALTALFLGLLSRATKVEIARYLWQPSSVILLLTSSLIIIDRIRRHSKKILPIILTLVIIMPYLYAATYTPERDPRMGEPRLAPVTLDDRIELTVLAVYGIDGYYLIGWHDVAMLPPKNNVTFTKFIKLISYYPMYAILINVSKDEATTMPPETYFVLPGEIIKVNYINHYNIVFSGLEHKILLASYKSRG